MLEKGKFLEKTSFIIVFVVVFWSKFLFAENIKSKILIYNNNLKNSSALFIQNDEKSIEEGEIFFGSDRIKINYTKPQNITLILSEKKGIYTNHELKDSEYFNTNKSFIKFFFKILRGDSFPDKPVLSKNFIELSDNFNLDDKVYIIKFIYENHPLKLRKVVILENNKKTELSFFNHNNIESYEREFFSMADPYLY